MVPTLHSPIVDQLFDPGHDSYAVANFSTSCMVVTFCMHMHAYVSIGIIDSRYL